MAFQEPSTGDSFTIILYRHQAASAHQVLNPKTLEQCHECRRRTVTSLRTGTGSPHNRLHFAKP